MIKRDARKGATKDQGKKVAAAMHPATMLMLVAIAMTAIAAPASATDAPKVRILNAAPETPRAGTQPGSTKAEEADPPKINWKMSWWGLPRAATAGSERLAALIRTETKGRWTLDIRYGAELSHANRNLDGLRAGRFQMAAFCDFFHPRKNPALTVLSLPFLPIADPETNRRVRDAVYAHPVVRAEFSDIGVRLYTSTYLPPFELVGRGDPPENLGYWQGRAIRAGGGVGRAMSVLGAIPVNATLPEIADGLRDGAIQVAALPQRYALGNEAIRHVAKWYTSNLAAGSVDCPIAISADAYASLPQAYQDLLAKVRPMVVRAQLQAWRQAGQSVQGAHAKGPRKITLGPAEIAAYRKTAGRPVIEAWIEQHSDRFEARGLVRAVFAAAGDRYKAPEKPRATISETGARPSASDRPATGHEPPASPLPR
jgi:TRAP-type C4-dicarboxylate transport system substrate-binding protein